MVKKIRFQENRRSRRRHRESHGAWVFEPFDSALIGAAIILVVWIQLVSHTS